MQGRAYTLHQGRIVPWLCDEIKGSQPHALHCQGDAAPGRHEYDRGGRGENPYLPQKLQTFLSGCGQGVVHVHENQFRLLPAHSLDGLLGSGYRHGRQPGPAQQESKRCPYRIIIVYNQYHNVTVSVG